MGNCKTKILRNTHKAKNKNIISSQSNEPNDEDIVIPLNSDEYGNTVNCDKGQPKSPNNEEMVSTLEDDGCGNAVNGVKGESNARNDGEIVTPKKDNGCSYPFHCVKSQSNEPNDGDIVVPLGELNNGKKIHYNVSEFLRRHESTCADNRIVNANSFVRVLDEKVHISATDPRYSNIYHEIDTIVQWLVEEFAKLDPFFRYTKLCQTGSILSNLKVGLPHESDYVLELLKGKTCNNDAKLDGKLLHDMVFRILKPRSKIPIKGLDNWVLYGVKIYRRIQGICLIMTCQSTIGCLETVGVTVDIVPVNIEYETKERFNTQACKFLPHSLEEYSHRGELYRLLPHDITLCDTGLIENLIMKELPDETKRPFRVIKFLLQHLEVRHRSTFKDEVFMNQELYHNIFGGKPILSSYYLRAIFLHLLFNIKGTEVENKLKEGLLAICLIDMLKQCDEASGTFSGRNFYTTCPTFYHPLIANETALTVYFDHVAIEQWDNMLYNFETENSTQAMDRFKLLNDKGPVQDRYRYHIYFNTNCPDGIYGNMKHT